MPVRTSVRAVRIRAYAKINLDLRVLGVRADGFHELRTVYQSIAVHDTLECVSHDGPFALECATAEVPLGPSNLIWRAAEALWLASGRAGSVRGVTVRLGKQIPMQAGLGGGSSDAAAALVGLARLWEVPGGVVPLADIAAALGADVPFFLTGGTALGLGRGDVLRPLPDLPHHWIVLLTPDFGVSTADAYGWYDADLDSASTVPPSLTPDASILDVSSMTNDLEPPVTRRHPEIGRMAAALRDAGAVMAAMSGSGSTVFGLFPSREAATTATERLQGSPWRVLLTETIARTEYGRRSLGEDWRG